MVRLTELEPRWYEWEGDPHAAIMLKCPHCGKVWLTCTFVALNFRCQVLMFHGVDRDVEPDRDFPDDWVPCEMLAWAKTGDDFDTLSVTPSIDASKAGHWHGHITKGEIV